MEDDDLKTIKESSAVQAHISMMQNIINRMASNSSSCKNWSVTIITGIVALYVANPSSAYLLLIGIIPVLLFCLLDSYYLSLERSMRNKQAEFIEHVNAKDTDWIKEVFAVSPTKKTFTEYWDNLQKQGKNLLLGFVSLSTTPFYLVIALLMLAIYIITPSVNAGPETAPSIFNFYNLLPRSIKYSIYGSQCLCFI